jgi:hypothetical protein
MAIAAWAVCPPGLGNVHLRKKFEIQKIMYQSKCKPGIK